MKTTRFARNAVVAFLICVHCEANAQDQEVAKGVASQPVATVEDSAKAREDDGFGAAELPKVEAPDICGKWEGVRDGLAVEYIIRHIGDSEHDSDKFLIEALGSKVQIQWESKHRWFVGIDGSAMVSFRLFDDGKKLKVSLVDKTIEKIILEELLRSGQTQRAKELTQDWTRKPSPNVFTSQAAVAVADDAVVSPASKPAANTKMPDISGYWLREIRAVRTPTGLIRGRRIMHVRGFALPTADFMIEMNVVGEDLWPRLKWSPDKGLFEEVSPDTNRNIQWKWTLRSGADGKVATVHVIDLKQKEKLLQIGLADAQADEVFAEEWKWVETDVFESDPSFKDPATDASSAEATMPSNALTTSTTTMQVVGQPISLDAVNTPLPGISGKWRGKDQWGAVTLALHNPALNTLILNGRFTVAPSNTGTITLAASTQTPGQFEGVWTWGQNHKGRMSLKLLPDGTTIRGIWNTDADSTPWPGQPAFGEVEWTRDVTQIMPEGTTESVAVTERADETGSVTGDRGEVQIVVQLLHADPKLAVESLQRLFAGRINCWAMDRRTIAIRAASEVLEEAREILKKLDTPKVIETTQASRQFAALPNSPAAKQLLEQFHAQESAAKSEAERIRQLQANDQSKQNTSSIAEHQRKLKALLSTAFDLKLQMEELQVKELQSRLSQLDQQIGQRKQLRDKIIARRALELIEGESLKWNPGPATRVTSSVPVSRTDSAQNPATSPELVAILRERVDLLFKELRAGNVKPGEVLQACNELAKVEPGEAHTQQVERLISLVELTESLHKAGQIPKTDLLAVRAAYEEARNRMAPMKETTNSYQTRMGSSKEASVRFTGLEKTLMMLHGEQFDLGAEPTVHFIREPVKIQNFYGMVSFDPGSAVMIPLRLAIYPIDLKVTNVVIPFSISPEDTREVWNGEVVTKVVYLPDSSRKKLKEPSVKTLVSTELPPGTDLLKKADQLGTILAVLQLARGFEQFGEDAPTMKQVLEFNLYSSGSVNLKQQTAPVSVPGAVGEGRFLPDEPQSNFSASATRNGSVDSPIPEIPPSDADETKLIARIEQLGGKVERDDSFPGRPVVGISFVGGNGLLGNEDLPWLAGLRNLTKLDLSHTQITDIGLTKLRGLNNLKTLNLDYTSITDVGLRELRNLTTLTSLSLWRTGITDFGLRQLRDLSNLRTLRLMRTKITDAGLHELRDLKNLQTLDLSETNITTDGLKELSVLKNLKGLGLGENSLNVGDINDEGMKELVGLTNLTSLDLNHRSITDVGLTEVGKLKQLKSLNLTYAKITGLGLKELSGLKSLTDLEMNYVSLGNVGLRHLSALSNLTSLDLYGSHVTDNDLKTLGELKNLKSLDLQFAKITDQGLKELKGLHNLESLSLLGTQITDEGLKELAPFKNLKYLCLWSTSITDAGLKNLRELTNLANLDVSDTRITGTGFGDLKELANLKELDLSKNTTSDAGLRALSELKNLRSLKLLEARITSGGVKELSKLHGLTELALNSTIKSSNTTPSNSSDGETVMSGGLTNWDLLELGKLTNLTSLHVGGSEITDAGLKLIADLKHLTGLSVTDAKITDTGLKVLSQLKNLTELRLVKTKVTEAAMKEFQMSHPGMAASTDSGFHVLDHSLDPED